MEKKLILGLLLLVIFVTSVSAYSNSCQLAYPMMEVLECESADSFSQNLQFVQNSTNSYYYATEYTCTSECNVDIRLTRFDDSWSSESLRYQFIVNGEPEDTVVRQDVAGWSREDITAEFQRQFSEGQEFTLITNAERRSAVVTDKNKYLYATNHEWPHHKLTTTQNCIPQDRVKSLIDNQVASGNLPSVYRDGGVDALGNQLIEPENFIDLSLYNVNEELKVGDTISYFYRWTTVPDLNLAYNRQGTEVYCGGSTYNRKIYSYATVNTKGGNCYNVPSSQIKTVECCSDSDCGYNNKVCGPDFTCTNRKPCDSDFQCGSIEPTCSNKQLTSWSCDTSTPDFTLPNGQRYKGWCEKEVKQVACCDNSCPVNYHCDYIQGCVRDVHFMACPPGSCCLSGGDYNPKDCTQGYECCTNGGYVGQCKSSCEFIPLDFGDVSYCDDRGSVIGSMLDFAGNFIPGLNFLTSTFDFFDDEVCDEQAEEVESGEAMEEDLLEGGGFTSIIMDLILSLF